MSVVLGYDESPGAERALRVALEVAAAFGEPLVLVYGAAAPGPTGEEYRAHREAVREAGRSALARAVEAADEAGVPSTIEVADAKPAQALLDAAERHDARVIIVGSWGDSPIRGALLGSTPHKLLHLSPVPVLCVPTEHAPGD
ncbi:universal stress protein [Streptomyces sp. NBC_01264]|uniref:universal stress protein n=1 Tax=Streptomyces sp. NBC_01264 TaxID=2903804 RepID=UPI002251B736|nr:universal stress protein [Streptomyces sp. NBC_01264]MCX4776532.1 universal stress protein [Streptomyces sp. NBC_01264]